MKIVASIVAALLLTAAAAAQDSKEPIALNQQFAARMTSNQALALENANLKLGNAYMQIFQQAQQAYQRQTAAVAADRAILIEAILKQNPGLAWDDEHATFVPAVKPQAQVPRAPKIAGPNPETVQSTHSPEAPVKK